MKRTGLRLACLTLCGALALGAFSATALCAPDAQAQENATQARSVYFGYPSITDVDLVGDGTSARINWLEASGAEGYYVKRASTYNGNYETVATCTPSTCEYTDTNLAKGTEYYYRVYSYAYDNGELKTHESSYRSIKTVPAKSAIKKLERTSTGIAGSVKTVAGASGYYIYRSTKEKGTYKQVATAYSSGTFYDNTADKATSYYYKVVPYVNNYSNGNTVVSKAAKSSAKYTLGMGYLAKSKKISRTSFKFTWSKVKDADGYYVYRSTKMDSGYKKIKTVGKSTTSFKTPGNAAHKTYYYKVIPYKKVKGKTIKSQAYNCMKTYWTF